MLTFDDWYKRENGVTFAESRMQPWMLIAEARQESIAACHAYMTYLMTALTATPSAQTWQPMDTAPKDGTPLLLFASLYQSGREFAPTRTIGWFIPEHGWIANSYSGQGIAHLRPKAWMHLPPFPDMMRATNETV